MSEDNRQPVLFISHGGGPWPWMPETKRQYHVSVDYLSRARFNLKETPKSILMISAHWETKEFTVSTNAQPQMIYDYGGFPPHTYQIVYPAGGSPELAGKVGSHLTMAGMKVEVDAERGFDHGAFVPLSQMFPDADIPVATLSIKSNYNPLEHFKMGEALEPLRSEGVLIIASGLTFHNLRQFNHLGHTDSEKFEHFLQETIALDKTQRREKLLQWDKAPSARAAHPREDHLVPLFVAAGAAGNDKGSVYFTDVVNDVVMGNYVFGEISNVSADALKAMGLIN